MGTVTTGTGLVSGIDYASLIDNLINLEARPRDILQNRIDKNNDVFSLLSSISLQLTSSRLKAAKLTKGQVFTTRAASTSSSALSATAGAGTTPGTYSFTPKRLVSTQQSLSQGYASKTATGQLASSPSTMTISQGGFVDSSTKLSTLNGGSGVQIGSIRIQNGASSTVVDLNGSLTVDDVLEKINASDANVVADVKDGKLTLTPSSGSVTVTEVGGGTTAADLGLDNLTDNGGVFEGEDVLTLSNSTSLTSLNNGTGVRTVAGNDFEITSGLGTTTVNLGSATTLEDVVNAINNAGGTAGVTASIDTATNSLRLDGAGAGAISVSGLNNSQAAYDLGLTGPGVTSAADELVGGNRLGGLNTVLLTNLRGGYSGSSDANPLTTGTIDINGTSIDLSGASTLDDVIDGINSASGSTNVTARVNDAHNGIVLERSSGTGITVSDVTGNLSSFLKLDSGTTGNKLNSGGLDSKYISANTQLAGLNYGAGVAKGKIQITDGTGVTKIVDLSQENDTTIGRVIEDINGAFGGSNVVARINDTGDGILLENTYGSGAITVTDLSGGTTAKSLKLTGTADSSGNINGRFQTTIDVDSTDSLNSLVTKLNATGTGVAANVINDGSSTSPFRLNITSRTTGSKGQFLLDAGDVNLNLTPISKGQDAVVVFGSGTGSIQLTSSTNSFTDLVPGLTIKLESVSDTPVSVNVTRDTDGITEAAQSLVDAINETLTTISENRTFDGDTSKAGLLFTNSTAKTIEQKLKQFVTGSFAGNGGSFNTLKQVGISLNSEGQVELDEAKLNSVLSTNYDDVVALFSATESSTTNVRSGAIETFQNLVDSFTDNGGSLTGNIDSLSSQIEDQNSRILSLNESLESKRTRLTLQFAGLETTLANLQAQQSSLTQLADLATQLRKG